MALNLTTAAFGLVVLGGVALTIVGHPKGEPPPSPTTPGRTVASPAPAAVPAAPPAPAAEPAAPTPAAPTPAAPAPAAPVPAAPSPAAPSPAAPAAAPAPTPSPDTRADKVTGGGFTLTSSTIELPTSDRAFPPGPGVEIVQQNCVACHSAGMVLNQPALPKATWDAEVHKMMTVYKAPVSPEDAATIIDYLASIKSPA